MRSRIKISKQQMKQDSFTTFMLKAKDFFLENWQLTTIIIVAVVLVIVGVTYYANIKSNKQREAANRMSNAIGELRRQNYQVAILELNSIIDEYSGNVAGLAHFYAGNAYYESRNYDEAINSYRRYVDKFHQDKLTTASAMAGIAACLENKQEFQPAAEQFTKAADYYPAGANVPDYLVGAVRNYVNAGMRAEADKILARLEEDFSGTVYYRNAVDLAMQLKTE